MSATSETNLRSMFFEDFVEGFARLAMAIVLPTQAEVEVSGAADAGEFIRILQASANDLRHFIDEKTRGWQHPLQQRPWDCVNHLLLYVIRSVEESTSRMAHGALDFVVTEDEAYEFYKRRSNNVTITEGSPSSTLLDGVRTATAVVRQRHTECLRKIQIFESISDAKLGQLVDVMTPECFVEGQNVVEQDDPGHELYVIIQGKAASLRYDEKGIEHKEGELSEGDYFGERALREGGIRAATVKVLSDQVFTLSLSKETYEKFTSGAFEDNVPERSFGTGELEDAA